MLSRRIKSALVVGGLALWMSLSYILGWPWNTDMIQQPSLRPYQTLLLPPPYSIPVGGEPLGPRHLIAERVRNPREANAASLERGKKMYLIYCVPCHGEQGRGKGRVAQGEFQPPDLTLDRIQKMNDETLYGTITVGWLTMPSYRETMTVSERWDVVNYVRALQKNREN